MIGEDDDVQNINPNNMCGRHNLQAAYFCTNPNCRTLKVCCESCIRIDRLHSSEQHYLSIFTTNNLKTYFNAQQLFVVQFVEDIEKQFDVLIKKKDQFLKCFKLKYFITEAQFQTFTMDKKCKFIDELCTAEKVCKGFTAQFTNIDKTQEWINKEINSLNLYIKQYFQSQLKLIIYKQMRILTDAQRLLDREQALECRALLMQQQGENFRKSSEFHYLKGFTLKYLGQVEQARESFLQALKLDPTNYQSMYCLGNCYYIQNDLNKAQQWWDKSNRFRTV